MLSYTLDSEYWHILIILRYYLPPKITDNIDSSDSEDVLLLDKL